jgi:hypothetical protein
MSLSTKVHQARQGIIERFQNGNISKAIAISTFLFPTSRLLNGRFLTGPLCLLPILEMPGGYRQWQKVGCHVKKKAKAFTILAPSSIKNKAE